MKLGPNVRVTENIELIAPIAQGAMGSVWVAYHWRLQTKVAVKFVSDRLTEGTEEALARLEREATAAAQIKSPHVVQTFDSGVTSSGAPYIVMELLEGETLGARLTRAGPLGLEEAATVIAQISRAIGGAHDAGIVHRDIKPDNVFLCESDDGIFCKVLDFGIAKQTKLPAMGGLTTEGKLVGTPEYMAPEQVLDEGEADFRTDLWSLGVLMYKSLTGELPFSGKTLGQLCLNLVGTRPRPPSVLRPELPLWVDHWTERVLNRDPFKRFNSAREMATAFAARAIGDDGLTIREHAGSLPPPPLTTEDTEQHFGAALGSVPPGAMVRRLGTPTIAVLVMVAMVLLATAGVVLATDTSAIVGAPSDPVLPRFARLAVHLIDVADTVKPSDLDDDDNSDEDDAGEADEATAATPQRPWPGRGHLATPAKSDTSAAPTSAAPPPTGTVTKRGKSDLGF
ncbi:MAG: serine/threonine protein kinase [Deltaproteobacteria bacterium]|nr:MAG: serine/threonine protein kinase [Deltaproteobacteria bacterium]